MRLIDAENIRLMDKHIDKIRVDDNLNPYIYLNDFVEIIDKQPTAYDIDKVVKELEKYKKKHMYSDGHYLSVTSKAIEIVKRGGKNES